MRSQGFSPLISFLIYGWSKIAIPCGSALYASPSDLLFGAATSCQHGLQHIRVHNQKRSQRPPLRWKVLRPYDNCTKDLSALPHLSLLRFGAISHNLQTWKGGIECASELDSLTFASTETLSFESQFASLFTPMKQSSLCVGCYERFRYDIDSYEMFALIHR